MLIKKLKRLFRNYNVEFGNWPADFLVTEHARERMVERLGVHPDKIGLMVYKAWLSKEPLPKSFVINKKIKLYRKRTYKFYVGGIFVFKQRIFKNKDFTQKVLLTVIRPNEKDYYHYLKERVKVK